MSESLVKLTGLEFGTPRMEHFWIVTVRALWRRISPNYQGKTGTVVLAWRFDWLAAVEPVGE